MKAGMLLALAVAMAAGCAPSRMSEAADSARAARADVSGPKVLNAAITEDPGNFWDALTGGGGSGSRELGHMVNQFLTTTASDGTAVPRLLAELPDVSRGTWRVLPDGGMETTLKLRGDVVWHDGEPFTADDVAFSWLVNKDPDVPNSNAAVARLISSVDVRDSTTAVLTWSELYPYADRIGHRELFTLPRHLLEQPYQDAKDALIAQPYFSDAYVGLGPYRVERWERGSDLELRAFERYFLGRPKIDVVRVSFIPDANTLLANLKARAIQLFLPPGGPDFESLVLVKQDWESSGYGTGLIEVARWKFMEPQKGRTAQPADLSDARARQALLLAVNREEFARAMYGQFGTVADSWVHPSFTQYPQIQDAITKYPFDSQRAIAILADLGWQRGPDGVLEKGGQRFSVKMRDRDDPNEALVIADNWKGIGVEGTFEQQTPQELRDRVARAQYTGVEISRGSMPPLTILRSLRSGAIPTPENKWAGSNRGAYSSPVWDALDREFVSALEETKRVAIEREMVRVLTSDLPLMPLTYDPDSIPVGGGLTGVQIATGTSHNGQIMHTWNIHEWDMRPQAS
ncbi:MAG TPA: ABC transporter substrate-binding protein [Chloroflexota bacterium]|nr:ABC transporter substrate-binding protein [Chloroflexota bacterium]